MGMGSYLLNEMPTTALFGLVGVLECCLDFDLDLLPKGGHKFDVYIGFKKSCSDLLERCVDDLETCQLWFGDNLNASHAFSSTTGALFKEESAALSLRPRSARTMMVVSR